MTRGSWNESLGVPVEHNELNTLMQLRWTPLTHKHTHTHPHTHTRPHTHTHTHTHPHTHTHTHTLTRLTHPPLTSSPPFFSFSLFSSSILSDLLTFCFPSLLPRDRKHA